MSAVRALDRYAGFRFTQEAEDLSLEKRFLAFKLFRWWIGLQNYVLLESEGVAVATARCKAPMSGNVVCCAKTTGAAGFYG